ncbi:hypothetical protein [Anditalea andensis]|uniref:Uncharacterized protein n=1 Tax=Anditalea andensis TaxID=1048983 RepID=A0A074L462_9BACT|nr:hypothetical protein [Anditalea andensis]KEO75265.1 hypothetical protein EL17_01625 [Anditalea andensis]
MKIYLLCIFLTLTGLCYGQAAMTFDEALAKGINIEKLDKEYKSGIHSDTSLAVFKNVNEYISAYQSMLQELGKHLQEKGFKWSKPTKCFNRIYFAENGEVDYFLFNFYQDEISIEQEEIFKNLLNDFIQEYRFPIREDEKFAQCSPVNYKPVNK